MSALVQTHFGGFVGTGVLGLTCCQQNKHIAIIILYGPREYRPLDTTEAKNKSNLNWKYELNHSPNKSSASCLWLYWKCDFKPSAKFSVLKVNSL